MPTFSLFPKKSYMDLSTHESFQSSSRHSPNSSFSSMMDGSTSTASSVTSVAPTAYDFLPPIRTASPLQIHREQTDYFDEPFEGYEDVLADYTELPGCYSPPSNDRTHYRATLQKPLPDVPQTIFDRLQAPAAFHPTRRAPLPPSGTHFSDDESDWHHHHQNHQYHEPAVVGAAGRVGGHGKIEREIMKMLQFNEEKEVERRVLEEKKAGKRKSNLLGFFTKGLRRSGTTTKTMQCTNEYSSKRASYFM
jgi:hypothetical protein